MSSQSRYTTQILRIFLIVGAAIGLAGCPESGAPSGSNPVGGDGGDAGNPGTVVAGDVAVGDGGDSGDSGGADDGASDGAGGGDGGSGGGQNLGDGDSGGDGSGGDGSGGDGSSSDGNDADGGGGSGSVTTPPPPRLVLSSMMLNFGSSDDELTLNLSNGGTGEVSYTLSSSDPWITISPVSGRVVAGTPVTVTVHVDRSNLWLGTFWSQVSAVGSDGSNGGMVVIVTKSGVPAPREQVVSWLRQLPPLQKKHFTWKPSYSFYYHEDEALLYEMIRINNGVTWADWPNAVLIDKLVRLCKQVNQTNPVLPTSIAFVDSPWTRHWPQNEPPTYNGPERAQELAAHAQQLATLTTYLATSNARYNGPAIELSHIAYDTELWRLRELGDPDYQTWNTAMRANYDDIYNITKTYFPNAPIDWYSRGWIRFFGNYEPPAWADIPYYHFDLSEQGDVCSAVMYRLPMQDSSREVFTRTVQYAAGAGVDSVVPWISLAAGYKPIGENNVYYEPNWNYDMQVSWNFGREINDLSNPTWTAADWVMIYPSPFESITPYYGQHYVAYVRGAHNVPALPR